MTALVYTISALWLNFAALFHPFHVSVSTIHFSEEEQSLQITMKIFADDLEETLNNPASRQSEATYIDILNPQNPEEIKALVEQYVSSHFSIKLNGQATKPVFLGYELEELAMWCYLEISDVESLQKIEVKNAVLTERFDDQVNIVNIQYLGDSKSMKLASNKLSDVVSF